MSSTNPIYAASITAMVFGAAFLFTGVPAQESGQVRLGDLFEMVENQPVGEQARLPKTREELSTMELSAVLLLLEDALRLGDHNEVLQSTSFLLSALPNTAVEYPEVMFLRAKAFDATESQAEVTDVARRFLREFPDHPHATWFLAMTARDFLDNGQPAEASRALGLLVQRAGELSSAEALDAALLSLRVENAKVARVFLHKAGETENPIVKKLELDSLLLEDESAYDAALYEGTDDRGVLLRLGLLMEARQQNQQAMEVYVTLVDSPELSEAEQRLLKQRIVNLSGRGPFQKTITQDPSSPESTP